MSKADDRRKAQAHDRRDDARAMHERPNEAPHRYDPDPRSWNSQCYGWRCGFHERINKKADAIWVCRWCALSFTNPAEFATPQGDGDPRSHGDVA